MKKELRLYRGQQPTTDDVVDMSAFNEPKDDVVDMSAFNEPTPKKKDEAVGGVSLFSASKFSLSLDGETDDPVADRILKNKRKAIGKSGDSDPRKRLSENLAKDVWSVTKGIASTDNNKGFMSRENVNQMGGSMANELRVASSIDPTQEEAAKRATKIEQGDLNEITRYTREKQDRLRRMKEESIELSAPTATSLKMERADIPLTDESKARVRELDDQEDDLITTATSAIRHSIVDKYDQSGKTEEDRKKLGADLRRAFESIGVNPIDGTSLKEEEGILNYARANKLLENSDYIDGGKDINLSKKKDEYQQQHDYNNEMEVIKSLIEVKGKRLEELANDPVMIEFGQTTDARRRELASHPVVQEVMRIAEDMNKLTQEAGESGEKIAEKYPTVRNQQQRELVIDAFAQHLTKTKEQGYESERVGKRMATFGKDIWSFVSGDRIDTDEEVQAIVKATGIPEDRVREMAKDYKLPSELRRGLEYFTNTFRSVNQYINRATLDNVEADIVNKEIEANKYKAAKSRQLNVENLKNFNIYALTDQLVETAIQGTSEFAAYSVATLGLGGIATGAGRVLGMGTSRVAGAVDIATKAPRLNKIFQGTNAALTGEAAGGFANVLRATTRARDLGATYATGYASSYEDSYQEAKRFTDDEDKREQYANRVAFLNGISELILPDIDIAKRMAAISGVKRMLRDGNVSLTRSDVFKSFMANLGSTVGQEVLEEYVPMVGEVLLKSNLFGYQTSTSEFLQQLADTTINTVVSSMGAGLGSARSVSGSSRLNKQALFEAGKTAEKSLAYIDKMKGRGAMSDAQVIHSKKLVNTMADIINRLPSTNNAGTELSEHAKVELAAATYDIRAAEEEAKNTDSRVTKRKTDIRIAEAQARINAIMGGAKTRTEVEMDNKTNQPQGKPVPPTNTQSPEDLADSIGFGSFTATPQVSKKPVRTTNPIAQQYVDQYGITSVDEIDDNEPFVLTLMEDKAAQAEALGATVTRSPGRRGARRSVQATFTGQQLKTFINSDQNAIEESQKEVGQVVPQSSEQQHLNVNEREQVTAKETTQVEEADNRNRTQRSRPQEKVSDLVGEHVMINGQRGYLFQDGQRVVARMVTGTEVDLANIEDTTPLNELGIERVSIGSNADGSVIVNGKRYRHKNSNLRKSIKIGRNGEKEVSLIDENGKTVRFRGQTAEDLIYEITLWRPQHIPSPFNFSLTPTGKLERNEEAENISEEIQNTESVAEQVNSTQDNQPAVPEQPRIERIEGVYEFGQIVSIPIDDVVYDDSYNKQAPNVNRVRSLIATPTADPVLVYRDESGQVYVLEGKEILAAAVNSNQPNVNVRFFNGTEVQARDFVASRSPVTTKDKAAYQQKRINRVLSNDPKSFEEMILQGMLGMMESARKAAQTKASRTRALKAGKAPAQTTPQPSRKPYAFSLADLASITGFGGERKGKRDLNGLLLNGVVSDDPSKYNLVTVESSIEDWVGINENVDELDLRNQWGDIIISYQTREAILSRLEQINNINEPPMKPELVHIHMTSDELLYAAENNLGSLLYQISENAGDIMESLNDDEQAYYVSLINRFDEGGGTFNMEGMANELFYAQNDVAVSFRTKLLNYGSIQEIRQEQSEPNGDIGSETFLEATHDEESGFPEQFTDEEAPFSRNLGAQVRGLTVKQARKVAKLLGKAFKGLVVHVDKAAFENARDQALARLSKELSERARMLSQQLDAARNEMVAAERARNSKAKQLDRGIQQDTTDLFGESINQTQQAQANQMFNERVDPKARAAAMKPFNDRYNKARDRVNKLAAQLQAAITEGHGPQQTTMFQVDMPPNAEVRHVENLMAVTSSPRALGQKEYERKYGQYGKGGRSGWFKYLGRTLSNGLPLRTYLNVLGQQFNLPPQLLYTSAMEEGMERRFADPNMVSEAYINAQAKDDGLNNFPVDGFYNYGLDIFGDMFPSLVEQGYLPQEFSSKFRTYKALNEQKKSINTAAFVDDVSALQAKAAVLKMARDRASKHMAANRILSTPQTLDLATLLFYNLGETKGAQMLKSYKEKGYFTNDAFAEKGFVPASWQEPFNNAQRRLVNANALVDMGFFSTQQLPQNTVMLSKDGQVLGLVLNGEVFLNPDAVRADTPLHEIGGHVLAQWARQNQPDLYTRMIELAKEAPQSLIDQVKKFYPELREGTDLFYEEVFATYLGQNADNLSRTLGIATEDNNFWNKVNDLIRELYQRFTNYLVDIGAIRGEEFNAEEYQQMSLADFSNMIGEKLMSGRRLSAPKMADARGFADYAYLEGEDFIRDKWNNIVGVKPSVMREIAEEKSFIKTDAIANGTYMLAPDGTPTMLSEDQWLTVRTRRFQKFDNPDGGSYRPGNVAPAGTVLRSANGEPRTFFHGTSENFSSFRDDRPAYFGETPEYADVFARRWYWQDYATGGNLVPVFIRSTNPFDITKPAHKDIYDEAVEGGYVSGMSVGDTMDYVDVQGMLNYFQATGRKFDAILHVLEDVPSGNINRSVAVLNPSNVKSAISNTTFSDEGNDLRYQRIGKESKLTEVQRDNLSQAEKMAKAGVSEGDIFIATGWFRDNADGRWRYELPNDNVRFKLMAVGTPAFTFWNRRNEWATMTDEKLEKELLKVPEDQRETLREMVRSRELLLSDLLDYPELFEAHPDLALLKIKIQPATVLKYWGVYTPSTDTIDLGARNSDIGEMYLTLRHEVQHALQHRLGFETGSNSANGRIYLTRMISTLRNKMKQLTDQEEKDAVQSEIDLYLKDQEYWAEHFYRNFAGEREAYAIMNRAKLPDELRMVAPPIQASAETAIVRRKGSEENQQGFLNKKIYGRTNEDQRSAVEKEVKEASVFFNTDGSIAFDRITQLKNRLKNEWAEMGNVGLMADNVENFRKSMKIYGTLLELAMEYVKAGAQNFTGFFADRRVLDAIQDGLGVPINSYADIPGSIRNKIDTILRMNERQLGVVKGVVDKVLKSKVKNPERKFYKELEAVQEDLDAANEPERKIRPKMRVDEGGNWKPHAMSDKEIREAKEYIARIANWQPVTRGMTAQQARDTVERMGLDLPWELFERETTRIALSYASMQALINEGVMKFGSKYATIVQMVLQDEDRNFRGEDPAKQAFITNVLQMGIFPRDVANKIAESRAESAKILSNAMNFRRIVNGSTVVTDELLEQTLGSIGFEINKAYAEINAEIKSNFIQEDIQEGYEGGMTDAEYDAYVAEVQANMEQRPTKTKKPLTDKEIKGESERAWNVLKSKTGKKSKKEIIDDINKQIKDSKC